MDFELAEEELLLKNSLKRFLDEKFSQEYLRELDEKKEFPHDVWKKMGGLGYLGLAVEEKYGGAMLPEISRIIMTEEIAKKSITLCWVHMNTAMICAESIGRFGTDEQKAKILPSLVKGDLLLCQGMTEPDAGSDMGAIRTTAIKDGNDFIINGSKMFCSEAHMAEYMILLARTDLQTPKKYKGMSAILVDLKDEKIVINTLKQLGAGGSSTNEVGFDDVRVPQSSLLGEENRGWYVVISNLEMDRLLCGAMALGLAQSIFDYALKYSKERVQFGRPIGTFQVNQHMFADFAAEIQAASLLIYYTGWLKSKGMKCAKEASMAKLFATELAKKIAGFGMQIMGGYGYMMEYDMQRFFRESVIGTIVAGTSQVQRNIIAQNLGL